MVKPPTTMQPEGKDLAKFGRSSGKSFKDDSFHNYMARKIDLQRMQFGSVLPPPPLPSPSVTKPRDGRPVNNSTSTTSMGEHSPKLAADRPSKKARVASPSKLLHAKHTPEPKNSESGIKKRKRSSGKKRRRPFSVQSVLERLKAKHGDATLRIEQARKRFRDENMLILKNDTDELVELHVNTSNGSTQPTQIDRNMTPVKTVATPTVRLATPQTRLKPAALKNCPTTILLQTSEDDNQKGKWYHNTVSTGELLFSEASKCDDSNSLPFDATHSQEVGPSSAATPCQHPTPRQIRQQRPDLFFLGVVIKVNGYTQPDNERLKRLIQKHGGDYETYETTRVTHMIAESLSKAKIDMYKRQKNPRPVCLPSWIVESVLAKRLLPYQGYLLPAMKDEQFGGLSSFLTSTKPQPITKRNSQETTISTAQSKPHGTTSSLPNVSIPERETDKLRVAALHGEQTRTGATTHDVVAPKKSGPPTSTTDKYINGKIRTVGTDPTFLDSFFSSSRLSFIGSFKQRTTHVHTTHQTKPVSILKRRFVFHVDLDCFFVNVALRKYPQYRDKPVAISHHGQRDDNQPNRSSGYVPKNSSSECATCNYKAREYGVKKGMFLGRAKGLCPDLVVLPYDFEGYEEVSEQVLHILHRVASEHSGCVEPVSCDEAYMEIHLEAQNGFSAQVRAGKIAGEIRSEVFDVSQCTVSVGVATNKFLAKLGTDHVKPDGAFVVERPKQLLAKLRLRDLHGVGYRTEPKLKAADLFSVQDVWDLGPRAEAELCQILGPGLGKKIAQFCNGVDDRPVKPADRKTIGAECNYGVRFDGPYGIDHFIGGLADEVEKRMQAVGVKGRRVTLKVKRRKKGAKPPPKFLGHGSCHNVSKSKEVAGSATFSAAVIRKVAMALFEDLKIDLDDVRGMGVIMSKLDNGSGINSNGNDLGDSSVQKITDWYGQAQDVDDSYKAANEEEQNQSIVSQESDSSPALRCFQNETDHLLGGSPYDASYQEGQACAGSMKLPALNFQSQVRGVHDTILHSPPTPVDPSPHKVPGSSPKNHEAFRTPDVLVHENGMQGSIRSQVDVPSLSQLHMSQVKALPDDLQAQILKQIRATETRNSTARHVEQVVVNLSDTLDPNPRQSERATPIRHATCTNHSGAFILPPVSAVSRSLNSVARFRQTNLKRMMKLASVKAGDVTTDISLTQLDHLPLEIKLQVVNGDSDAIGVLSQIKRANSSSRSRNITPAPLMYDMPKSSTTASTNRMNWQSPVFATENIVTDKTDHNDQCAAVDVSVVRGDPKIDESEDHTVDMESDQPEPSCEVEAYHKGKVSDPVAFFEENIAPFKTFLDDNHPSDCDAQILVESYLTTCVYEARTNDAVTLLRLLTIRDDDWNDRNVIAHFARAVDEAAFQSFGHHLDLSYLVR